MEIKTLNPSSSIALCGTCALAHHSTAAGSDAGLSSASGGDAASSMTTGRSINGSTTGNNGPSVGLSLGTASTTARRAMRSARAEWARERLASSAPLVSQERPVASPAANERTSPAAAGLFSWLSAACFLRAPSAPRTVVDEIDDGPKSHFCDDAHMGRFPSSCGESGCQN
jgi:hypothetical protein